MRKTTLILGLLTISSFVGCGNENSSSKIEYLQTKRPPNPTHPQRPTGHLCDDVGARLGAAQRAYELEARKCRTAQKRCDPKRLQQAAGDLAAAQRIFNRCSKCNF